MEKSDFLELDGNQLRLFLAIHQAGSLSATGKMLDMNQSTVSYWLDLLRKRLNDPLFVRSGRGVEPTKRALELLPLAEEILRRLQEITEAETYAPEQDKRSLRIAATMFERDILLSKLIPIAMEIAPHQRIEFVPTGSIASAAQDLRDGKVDFTLMPHGGFEGEGLMQRALFKFRNFVYFDPAFPVEDGDLDEYCARPHVRVVLGSETGYELDKKLAKDARSRHIALQVPDFDSALKLIPGTRLLATLPSHLAKFSGKNLGHCLSPWPETEYTLMLFWHVRNQHNERHIFWRKKFFETAENMGER